MLTAGHTRHSYFRISHQLIRRKPQAFLSLSVGDGAKVSAAVVWCRCCCLMLKAPSFQPMLILSLYQSTWFQISIINPKFHICLLWTPDLGAPTNTLFYSLQNRITLTPYPSQPSQSGPHEGFCLGDSVQVTAHVNSKLHIRLLGVSCSLLLPAGRGAERVSLSWWCLIHISSSAPVAHIHSQSNIVRWPTWPLFFFIYW